MNWLPIVSHCSTYSYVKEILVCHSFINFSPVPLLSHVWLFATPWTAARQASPSITNSWSPPKPMSIESVMPSSHLILCFPLLLLPPIPPSIRVFSNESTLCMRWPKYWSFIFSISPSNEYPGLISFRMGWFDLLAVQGTLKSLLQQLSVFKFLISDYMVLMILIILVWIFWFLMKLNIKSIWFSFPINFLLIILLIFW